MESKAVFIVIRVTKSGDAPALQTLCTQLGYDVGLEDIVKRAQGILADPDSELFIYETAEGQVVGWAHVFGKHLLEGVYAELGGIVVDAQCRGRGIGGLLLKRCEQWAVAHDYNELRVRSNGKREGAHQFYLTSGYSCTKWQKVFCRYFIHEKS